MAVQGRFRLPSWVLAFWAVCLAGAGCKCVHPVPHQDLPREFNKYRLPEYVIEPPDILRIDAVRVVPKPPYRSQPLDALNIQVTETLPDAPIAGVYVVDPDGNVNLGFNYGTVAVVDLTLPEAKKAIEVHLKQALKPGYQVMVSLAQSRGLQVIRGDHLVSQDGMITLGIYGSVPVVGLTREEAKQAIETHLSQFLLRPEIALDIVGYNSKVYYVVTDGGGMGEQVYRFPIAGGETVLDGLGQINGLPPVASKKHVWLARPSPDDCEPQVFPVDWRAIVECGATGTNYQLFPGDRIYVKAQPLVCADNFLARLISPLERMLGVTLLGSTTIRNVAGSNQNGGNGNNSGGGF